MAEWDQGYAAELYNHTGDISDSMDLFENKNQVTEYPDIAGLLHHQLVDFFRSNEHILHDRSGEGKTVDLSDPYDF